MILLMNIKAESLFYSIVSSRDECFWKSLASLLHSNMKNRKVWAK